MTSVNVYYPDQPAVAPDVSVIGKKVRIRKQEGSYYVNKSNPAPFVAIEIASNQTWERDLKEKLERYEKMGTPEYFVFDPNVPQVWNREWRKEGRIVGWQLNPESKKLERLPVVQPGRIWSNQLDSWLVIEPVDELFCLRLYEQDGITHRPTIGEAAETAERYAASVERLANAEKQRVAAEKRKVEAEKRRADAAQRRADQEKQKVEQEKQRADNAETRLSEAEKRAKEVETELERLRKLLEKSND